MLFIKTSHRTWIFDFQWSELVTAKGIVRHFSSLKIRCLTTVQPDSPNKSPTISTPPLINGF